MGQPSGAGICKTEVRRTPQERKRTERIALRLPAPDLAHARELAERKGIGYQTLLKMLVHEGLRREARRT